MSETVSTSAETLLTRMRSGDREAAAEFVELYGPRIRRRVRGKLGPGMRRLFDSQEIMSTLGRRLDAFVKSGRMRAGSLDELWGLVSRIADNSLVEKARVFRSLEAHENEGSEMARTLLHRLRRAEARDPEAPLIEIDSALRSLDDALDREILSLWLMGNSHVGIAHSVDMTPAAVRKRWQRIRDTLRDTFGGAS